MNSHCMLAIRKWRWLLRCQATACSPPPSPLFESNSPRCVINIRHAMARMAMAGTFLNNIRFIKCCKFGQFGRMSPPSRTIGESQADISSAAVAASASSPPWQVSKTQFKKTWSAGRHVKTCETSTFVQGET